MIELSVKVSDDDQTLTEKYLLHEEGLVLSHECRQLDEMVTKTVQKFKGEPKDVLIRIKYTW